MQKMQQKLCPTQYKHVFDVENPSYASFSTQLFTQVTVKVLPKVDTHGIELKDDLEQLSLVQLVKFHSLVVAVLGLAARDFQIDDVDGG